MLIYVLSRPVYFGAKHTLFQRPLRPILEAFGAIPIVRAQDDPRAMRQNIEAFDRYAALLQQGLVTALFPEGLSQDDPHLAPVKTGAARIALRAESAADFKLGLKIVPIGLQFEPRRRFRADAFVRFGRPFPIDDLGQLHRDAPRRAIRELTERIAQALNQLAYHVESIDRVPFVERLTDVYFRQAYGTGLAGVDRWGIRGELLYRTAACLNYYADNEPAAVREVEDALRRYELLREKAGIDSRLVEEPSRLLPGPLAPFQAIAELVLGAVPALFGFLTNGVPYYLTRQFGRRQVSKTGHPASFSTTHILVATVAFPLVYGLEIATVWFSFSNTATITFALLLVPTGLFAGFYGRRSRKLAVHLGGRVAAWMKLDALIRVRDARNELVTGMDHMRDRYRIEVLGWDPVRRRDR